MFLIFSYKREILNALKNIYISSQVAYLALFVLVNMWTVSIHDADYRVPGLLKSIVNGSAHHIDHHLFYNCNYGQFFTLWDRIGGSYQAPSSFAGRGPLTHILAIQSRRDAQDNPLSATSDHTSTDHISYEAKYD